MRDRTRDAIFYGVQNYPRRLDIRRKGDQGSVGHCTLATGEREEIRRWVDRISLCCVRLNWWKPLRVSSGESNRTGLLQCSQWVFIYPVIAAGMPFLHPTTFVLRCWVIPSGQRTIEAARTVSRHQYSIVTAGKRYMVHSSSPALLRTITPRSSGS